MDTLLRSHRWLLMVGFLLVVAFLAILSFSRQSSPRRHSAASNVVSPSAPQTFSVSDQEQVKALADTNHDGTVTDTEALLVTLDVADAPDKPFDQVKKFDINGDGKVDNTDITLVLAALDALTTSK